MLVDSYITSETARSTTRRQQRQPELNSISSFVGSASVQFCSWSRRHNRQAYANVTVDPSPCVSKTVREDSFGSVDFSVCELQNVFIVFLFGEYTVSRVINILLFEEIEHNFRTLFRATSLAMFINFHKNDY